MTHLKKRNLLLKIYGSLYKRVTGISWDKCAYCLKKAIQYDHVPAITLLENIDLEVYRKKGGKLLLYPACKMCNTFLSNHESVSLYDRLDHLAKKYNQRLNRMESWSDRDIEEMGPNMRAYIEAKRYKTNELIAKLFNIEEQITKINLGELNEDGTTKIE